MGQFAFPHLNLQFYNLRFTTTRPGLLISHMFVSCLQYVLKDAMTPKARACIFSTEDGSFKTLIMATCYSPALSGKQIRPCRILKQFEL
jgi:hypothetical protein